MATKTSKPVEKYKPFKHQSKSIKFGNTTDEMFDMSDAGTGKTLVHMKIFEERAKKKGGSLIVLAPKSLLNLITLESYKPRHIQNSNGYFSKWVTQKYHVQPLI